MALRLTAAQLHWHYRAWQRRIAGYMRCDAQNRLPNNDLVGLVVNDKHPRTVKVKADRWLFSCRYQKAFRISKRVWAHDELEQCALGDVVRIQPMGLRIGPWKTYMVTHVLYREPVIAGRGVPAGGSDPSDELSDLEDDEGELERPASAAAEHLFPLDTPQRRRKWLPFVKQHL